MLSQYLFRASLAVFLAPIPIKIGQMFQFFANLAFQSTRRRLVEFHVFQTIGQIGFASCVGFGFVVRIPVRMAWEDIGLADPRAMQICNDAAETYERLGSPEGELALAQAVIYLAIAAKSNAGYNAYNAARALVAKDRSREVPVHLRNAPTKLMKELGYGHAYRYAHDEPEAYAAGETYLPDGLEDVKFYEPTPRGLEGKIGEKLKHLAELDRDWRKKNR